MLRFGVMFFLVLQIGCASVPMVYTHGVPNLEQVEPGIWRSGQPLPEGWAYLYGIGIRRIVKLNASTEGSDEGAKAAGIEVIRIEIPPSGITNLFDVPDGSKVRRAVTIANAGGGVLIHCTHGQDRTGLVIGLLRRRRGMSVDDAWREMLGHNFHESMFGLVSYWNRNKDQP